MKNTFYEFDPVLYPIKLWIIVTNSNKIINDKFYAYPEGEIGIDFTKVDAGVILSRHRESKLIGILIVFENTKRFTVENITHETCHATEEIWKHLYEQEWGSEANAYLSGWIADCCWKVKTGKV